MKNLDGLTWGWHPMPPVEGLPARIFPAEKERREAEDRVKVKRARRLKVSDKTGGYVERAPDRGRLILEEYAKRYEYTDHRDMDPRDMDPGTRGRSWETL